MLVSSQIAVKVGHGFQMGAIAVRMDNLRGGEWGEIQSSKYVLEIKLVFGCFYVFDIANTA